MFGPPSVVDYDLEAEGVSDKIAEDTEAHTDLNRVIGSVGTHADGASLIPIQRATGMSAAMNGHADWSPVTTDPTHK